MWLLFITIVLIFLILKKCIFLISYSYIIIFLQDPLETTLQEWGFQGVRGIVKYFYGDFTKMTETLADDCEYLIEEDKKKEKAQKGGKLRKLQKKARKRQRVEEDYSDITIIEDDVSFMGIGNVCFLYLFCFFLLKLSSFYISG